MESWQELYAIGASSLLGSLFSVYPVSTALGRTMVNVSSGTKTQVREFILTLQRQNSDSKINSFISLLSKIY